MTKRKKVQVRRYKDEILVDLREFYMNDIGEMCPSKKGRMPRHIRILLYTGAVGKL